MESDGTVNVSFKRCLSRGGEVVNSSGFEMINKCMKYTIYQITNKLNGKIYIGKHQTKNINDGYFGSGVALKEAVKKYGKEPFEKEILFVFDTEEEMNAKERELITEDFVKRKDTYNLGVGGEGGPHFKGKTHTEETRKKLSEIAKTKPKVYTEESKMRHATAGKNRVWSEETKRKISLNAYLRNGKTFDEAMELINNKKTKIKRTKSEALKEFYKDPENKLKKAEQMRKLHNEYELDKVIKDYNSGMKPKEIMKKYNMTKSRYDHIKRYYINN